MKCNEQNDYIPKQMNVSKMNSARIARAKGLGSQSITVNPTDVSLPEASHELLSHSQLATHIETEGHFNLYEHRESIFKFLGYFLFFALLGVGIGGLLDQLVKNVQKDNPPRWNCGVALLSQLLVVGLGFWFMLDKIKLKISFDDWMLATFSGFIFALTLFTSQTTLSSNIQCLIQFSF